MTRRRPRYDPLAPVNAPTWLVVRNKYSAPLEVTPLAPNADLRSVVIAEQARRLRDGWQFEETDLTSCSIVFCVKDGERISIGISFSDPRKPGPMDRPPAEAWTGNVVQLQPRGKKG